MNISEYWRIESSQLLLLFRY